MCRPPRRRIFVIALGRAKTDNDTTSVPAARGGDASEEEAGTPAREGRNPPASAVGRMSKDTTTGNARHGRETLRTGAPLCKEWT